MRHLVLILGDQLWLENPALAGFDPCLDQILMVEAPAEAAHVWSHKARIAVFFAAMRHFAKQLTQHGWPVNYLRIGSHPHGSIEDALLAWISQHRPQAVLVCQPGEWRLQQELTDCIATTTATLQIKIDSHFLVNGSEFADWAAGYKQLRMEYFYRWMRTKFGILMDDGKPAGGEWNFDGQNRASFGKNGPPKQLLPAGSQGVVQDQTTAQAISDVNKHFAHHPGSLDDFAWPVTRSQALACLAQFVEQQLPLFGTYQDAMWSDEPFLFHSLLSCALNLRLLNPREVIAAAERAYRAKQAPLAAVEGFIRQILGWREFIRGMYWLDMPALREANHFNHRTPLPGWYWTGATQMNCMRQTIGQTLRYGYAHHIQRLMITGNFALIAGLLPQQVSDWYLAVYVDAIEWVELPNVAGMTLYANGGRFTSKPYAASGAYVKRMSNYCDGCRYQPAQKTGPQACPMTVFYWSFLDRNERELQANPRTVLMLKNLARLSADERETVRAEAKRMTEHMESL